MTINYHYVFATLLLILTLQQSHAMDNKYHISEAKILATINAIQKPTQVICFPDIIAIAGANGCSLCDWSGKEITKLCDNKDNLLVIVGHPNKKIFATRDRTNLTVYDLTISKIWEADSAEFYGWPVFNSIDDTILIAHKSQEFGSFNYKNNFCEQLSGRPSGFTYIAFHPTKQEFIPYSQYGTGAISIQQLSSGSFVTKQYPLEGRAVVDDYKYSHDGSIVACNDARQGCLILDFESGSQQYLLEIINKPSHSIKFHPTSFVLAILSCEHDLIRYWNAKTRKIIATTSLPTAYATRDYNWKFPQTMDFSCDGKRLAVALKDKVLVLEVPFAARYKDLTKEDCIFAYLVLKNYLHEGKPLPCDITHLLENNLLEVSQYSFTNY